MVITITRYQRELSSVFQLLGRNEDDLTYAVGWCLAHCPEFIREVFQAVRLGEPDEVEKIALQEPDKLGRTDIEIHARSSLLIVEAKKGFSLPTLAQLKQYHPRFAELGKSAGALVILTDYNSGIMSKDKDAPQFIENIPIRYLGWQELFQVVQNSIPASRNKAKTLLRQLAIYLAETVTMPNVYSNMVWVVPLSNRKFGGGELSLHDIVETKNIYFHPIGKRYVSEPPNYIGFRHSGKLKSIHHIKQTDVVTNFHDYLDGLTIEPMDHGKHFLYHLGPAIVPHKTVKTGEKIYGPGRNWAMLDLLLTCDTVEEARDETQKRLK